MSQFLIANIGSYPRTGETKDQQRHRRALQFFQTGEISKHALRDIEQSVVQEIVREQIEAGLDEVTDGLVSWPDPISRLPSKLRGFKTGGLRRYFNANFYYRIPIIVSKPKRKKPLLIDDYEFAQGISNKPLRVVLTGPLTLAVHSNSSMKSYSSVQKRLPLFCDILQEEIDGLIKAGAKLIQIDEPSLTTHPQHLPLVEKCLERFFGSFSQARLILAVSFGAIGSLIDALLYFPIHALNLDLTYDGKKLIDDLLKKKTRLIIGFGAINARTTRLEPVDPILKTLRQYIETHNPPLCYLTPSTGLEFLPRDIAFQKLKLLAKIKEEVRLWLEKERDT
ncbi:MAG: hypothetical protein LHV69_06105 [Elusimicrobia bacterium]|nr:hypothetical protein [Candidatus Obscuribacterium magneticum]